MNFFSVIAESRTWRNVTYLLLAFPLGVFYFVFLVTGLSLGIGLLITLLGIPIIIGVLAAAHGLGAFERNLTNSLLGLKTPPAPLIAAQEGAWARAKALMSSSVTWRRVGYLLAVFPLGIAGLTLVAATAAVFAAGVVTPIFHERSWWFTTEEWMVDVWVVDSIWERLVVAVIGLLIALALTHVMNGVARLWGAFASRMLGPDSRA
ncbi:MAG: sensor domain-containing protein [Acidimicrobiia bacterium]